MCYDDSMVLAAEPVRKPVRDVLARIGRDPAALGLIGFNLAAGVIVLLHPPYTQQLFFLYWCDCVLVGLFGALKLFFVPVPLGPEAGDRSISGFVIKAVLKILLAAVFLFAYGFILVCATALLGGLAGEEARIRPMGAPAEPPLSWGAALPVGLLFAGRLFSFFRRFLGRREYRQRTAEEQIVRPFGRVLPLFFILVLGGIAFSLFRLPALLAVIFVLAKTAADLGAHAWEHGFLSPGDRPRSHP